MRLRRIGGLLLALWVAAAVPAAALVIPVQPERIVAVGDLHGDFAAWRAIAEAAGLVDARGRWTGGRTVVVQMGDVPDRGPDSRAIVLDLMRLERAAARAGGRVIVLVGNHEAMLMTGDYRYVSAAEDTAFADRQSERRRAALWQLRREAFEQAWRTEQPEADAAAIRAAWMAAHPRGRIELAAAWAPDGEIGRWVLGNPAVVRIGVLLFVHGGLSEGYAGWTIEAINGAVRQALAARSTAADAIIHDPAGPLWHRGFARAEAETAGELARVLERQGAGRLVIAHTPNLGGVLVLHGGRLARTDSGISAAYGGTLGWLEIRGAQMEAKAVARPPAAAAAGR